MAELIARLKQRKLVQWALAYIAAAFALLQGIDLVAAKFGLPDPASLSALSARPAPAAASSSINATPSGNKP
jgi:hypothetical protein